MSSSVVANRIYQRGRVAPEDVQRVGPDLLLLRALKPPKESAGGLALPGDRDDHPARACVAFTIVQTPCEFSRGNPLGLSVGDVVLCYNALVDPLLGNDLCTTNVYLGVVGVLERAPVAEKEAA